MCNRPAGHSAASSTQLLPLGGGVRAPEAMLRVAPLVLVLNVVCWGNAVAQENIGVFPATARDSVHAARAGELAASDPQVGGYFVASFLGGVPAGFLLPIGVAFSEPFSFALGGTGAGVIGLTTRHAARRGLPPDSIIRAHVPRLTREQVRVFRAAYRERLGRRRVRASLWGGAIGVGVGAGALVWLVSQLGDY